MTSLDYLMRIIASMKTQLNTIPSFRWATVQASSPLRIRFDGEDHDLSISPFNLAGALPVGARVWVATVNRRAFIIGSPSTASVAAPTGAVTAYAGTTPPAGWLFCDGSTYQKQSYPDLARVLGFTGAGTVFTVPDMRGRVPVGVDARDTDLAAVGKTLGEKTHTLTVAEIPAHKHDQYVTNPITSSGSSGRADYDSDSSKLGIYPQGVTTGVTGGGQAHNNMQPSLALHYIIRT